MSPETAVLAAMVVPVAGAAGIVLAHRLPNLRETITMITALALLASVLSLLPVVLAGERPAVVLFQLLPGISFGFRVEPLGMLFALVASGLWIVNSLYSIGYMRANDEHGQTRFYVCFALALAATMGIAFSANLVTLFLFYEVLTLVTYPLVTHHRDDAARRGGRIYMIYLLGSSMALLLVAVISTWLATGSVEFTPGGLLGDKLSNNEIGLLLALFIFGIGKAAVMPFHRWLPAAMVAPTPVSALLHAVAVVKAGVFTVVKVIVYVFGVERIAGLSSVDWLPFVAGFTIIAASVVALRADNLKRRLAYSTISQLSYVVLAAAILTPLSVIGAALHIAAHAVGKITLFFAAGAIYTAGHKTLVSELDGIGWRMPLTMTAFAIGAISMIGLPPAAGFVSKWYMLQGAVSGAHWNAVAVIAASTLLNAAYFLPIVYRAFFIKPAAGSAAHGEAPWTMVAALCITAAATILLFCFPDVPLALARQMMVV
ncbi:MAG: monovalent cation/H+ antiporter subunit D family protein [Burkholderiales bacterium]|nr:monovalent cation/H+ antiporter subunit D family protein [Burkholderiales bacterium]